MSDSWLPLPTHEGSWYMSVDGVSRPVDIIETEDGDGFCILRHEDDERGPKLVEESYIRYYPIPDPPPADSGKLPEGTWQAYVASLSQEDRDKMLNVILGHLLGEGMESDFCYRPFCDYGDGDIDEEAVFWRSSGENVLDS